MSVSSLRPTEQDVAPATAVERAADRPGGLEMVVAETAVRGQAERVAVDHVIEIPRNTSAPMQPFALVPVVVHRTVWASIDVQPAPGTIVAPAILDADGGLALARTV